MKRGSVFLLLFFYLIGTTGFGQILRLPVMLEHYAEHRSRSALDFSTFLYMHYIGDDQNPDDDQQDQQLPFKAADAAPVVSMVVESGPICELFATLPVPPPFPRVDNKPVSSYRPVILQPPRAV